MSMGQKYKRSEGVVISWGWWQSLKFYNQGIFPKSIYLKKIKFINY